jgi:peptidyl-prolyl cis-trans isomerase C
MQTKLSFFSCCCFIAFALPAIAADPVPPETPLIVDGAVKVDAADFEGNMLRIPENRRSDFRMNFERVATVVDNIFVARALAAKAREAGLDKDPPVQRRLLQLQDGFLADLYVQKMEREAASASMNFEARARELFKADQAKYVKPEHVYIQQILISLNARTRDSALELARKVHEEAKAGKEDFLALAARYSEDPDLKRTGGDMGYMGKASFPVPLAKAIETLKVKGEIPAPIESERGFHVVRFIDRQKEAPMTFEEVKPKLIAGEKQRLAKKRLEDLIESVKQSPTLVVHPENVEKMVLTVDLIKLQQAAEAASR